MEGAVVGDAVYFIGNIRGTLAAVAQREVCPAFDRDDGAAARACQNIAVEAQRYLARNEQVFRQFYICGKTVLAGCKFAPSAESSAQSAPCSA